MPNRICAGIVTYNPDIPILKRNISSLNSQVNLIIIFDNGSMNYKEIINIQGEKIVILHDEENKGIAYALNRVNEYGYEHGYEWILTLDQDSYCPKGFAESLVKYRYVEEKIGIVAPVIYDRNLGVVGHKPIKDYQEFNTCITSGSLNNIEAWKKVGGYDELMFIDSVDFDYCYSLREHGYRVIQVRDIHLEHEIGNGIIKRFLFWKVNVFGHSAFRKYYIARNNIYVNRKHRNVLRLIRGNFRNAKLVLFVFLFEDEKIEKTKSIICGWKDGWMI